MVKKDNAIANWAKIRKKNVLIFNLYEYDTFRYASESKFKCENENYPVTSNRNGSDSWDIAKFSRKRKKILSLFTISMIFENLQRVKWTLFICQRGTLSRLKDYYLREVVCSVSENLFVIRSWEIFEILYQSPKIGYRSFWPGGLLGHTFLLEQIWPKEYSGPKKQGTKG